LGDVGRPGGYPMTTNDSRITVLQALAMAGSANRTSILGKAKLVRKTPNGPQEVPMQLAQMQQGKRPDIDMQPDDVLFLPFSWMKNIAANAQGIAASATSAVIFAH
jgi:polysaccharide biosynthesis/export protein